MSDLQPYARRLARGSGSMLAAIETRATLKRMQIAQEAAIHADMADAIGAVAGRAMQDVALLSQMEQQLAQTVPMASGRLALIADSAALSLAEVVHDAAYRLRRC